MHKYYTKIEVVTIKLHQHKLLLSKVYNDLRWLRFQYNNLLVCEKTFPGQYLEQINAIRQQIDYFLKFNFKGAQIRSKIVVLESEQCPSQFFSKMVKRHFNKRSISKISHNNTEYPFGISWTHFSKILGTNLGNFLTDDDRWFGISSKSLKPSTTLNRGIFPWEENHM